MGATLNNKPSLVRLGAFAAVLLLTAGLLVTLFQEAQAANVVVEEIGSPSAGSSSHSVHVDIVVPENQLLPLVGISSVIESRDSETSKSSDSVSLVARDRCATPFTGCTSSTISHVGGTTEGILTQVQFLGAFVTDSDQSHRGYGYLNDNDLLTSVDSGYSRTDTISFTHREGYGYDSTVGYGYGSLTPGQSDGSGTGLGYGYADADLILRFQFTINPNQLGAGDYWFTALAETGSSATFDLSSAAQAFTVGNAITGPGSPGDDNGGGGGGSSGPDGTVDAGDLSDVPSGALEGWRASVTGDSGDTIRINTGSDRVPRVDFTLSGDADGADVDVVVYPGDSPPEGTPAASWRSGFIVQITISTEGDDHDVVIFVEIDEDDMEEGDEGNAFGAKHENPWVPLSKVDLTHDENASKYTGSFNGKCCSVFMVGFDEEDPTVTLEAPEGTLSGMVTFEAEVEDDVQVDRVEFYVGSTLIGSDSEAPFTVDWDSSAVSDGSHTVRAVAYDLVGNEAEDSHSVTVQQTGTDDGDDGGPAGGDPGGGNFPWWLIILIAIIVIGGAIWYASSQKKK